MIDIPQATIARAIDVLRAGPMRADEFARRMHPERSEGRDQAALSRSGHGTLQPMAQVGYVQKIGDLWTLRSAGTAEFPGATAVGLPVGPPVAPWVAPSVRPAAAPPDGPSAGPAWDESRPAGFDVWEADPAARLRRLRWLVGLATEPQPTVTHDATFGDIAVRDWSLDEWLVHACAYAVLRGKSMNVYPMGDEMIVALRPIEGARALYLRWQQSGEPPGLPNEDVWIFADDGIVADPHCWICDGMDPYEWSEDERANESVGDLMQRQREAAGLA